MRGGRQQTADSRQLRRQKPGRKEARKLRKPEAGSREPEAVFFDRVRRPPVRHSVARYEMMPAGTLVKRDGLPVPYQVLGSTDEAAATFGRCFLPLPHEELWIGCMDRSLRLTSVVRLSVGDEQGTDADPRLILRAALLRNSYLFVLAHNHPMGDPTPSTSDWVVTDEVCEGASRIGMECVDHLVFGREMVALGRWRGLYVSMRERNGRVFEVAAGQKAGQP